MISSFEIFEENVLIMAIDHWKPISIEDVQQVRNQTVIARHSSPMLCNAIEYRFLSVHERFEKLMVYECINVYWL